MNILYISNLCSEKVFQKVIQTAKLKPLQSTQKFHRLVCEGLVKNKCSLFVYSAVPVTIKTNKRIFWKLNSENINKIEYNYFSFLNHK